MRNNKYINSLKCPKYKPVNIEDKTKKMNIISQNYELPMHEIKKILRKEYPNVTNDEVIHLISEINKAEKEKKDLGR